MSTATVDLGGEVVLIVNSSDSPAKKKELTSSRKSSVSGNSTRPPISRKLLRQATMKDMTNHNITKSEKNATAAITHTTSLILTHGQEYRFGDNIDCTRLFVEYEVNKTHTQQTLIHSCYNRFASKRPPITYHSSLLWIDST